MPALDIFSSSAFSMVALTDAINQMPYVPGRIGQLGLRASEVASPRPDDQLTVGGETFVIQGEPERRDPDRLVWSLDVRSF